jgi:PDZ domain
MISTLASLALVLAAPPAGVPQQQQQKPQPVPGIPQQKGVPAPQQFPQQGQNPIIILDGNQQLVQPQIPQPKLPSDDELAKVQVPAELVRLARALDSDAFAERDAARKAVLERKPTAEELMALLLRTDLGEEARHQLVGILRERILRAPGGALGIRMENFADKDGGVRITALVPGMPAEKVLKQGDVVKRVNETQLRSTIDLMNAVQTLQPGVEVKLLVRRVRKDALAPNAPANAPAQDPAQLTEDLELTLRLGSTEELQEKGDPVLPGVAGQQVFLGGGGVLFYERQLRALMASKRFLSKPALVEFPLRDSGAAERPAVTVESVRKLLMELQLADGDADLVRAHRVRLDQIAEQIARFGDQQSTERARLQRALEALEIEIRGSF